MGLTRRHKMPLRHGVGSGHMNWAEESGLSPVRLQVVSSVPRVAYQYGCRVGVDLRGWLKARLWQGFGFRELDFRNVAGQAIRRFQHSAQACVARTSAGPGRSPHGRAGRSSEAGCRVRQHRPGLSAEMGACRVGHGSSQSGASQLRGLKRALRPRLALAIGLGEWGPHASGRSLRLG